MILSEQSLEDLNTRLEKKVTMTRFRPNISITGCVPYDEVNIILSQTQVYSLINKHIHCYFNAQHLKMDTNSMGGLWCLMPL
jgi:hypothetical protein